MEKILQRILLLLLLLPLSLVSSAQNYAEVLPGNSKVLKTDKVSGSETLSSITLEVTLAAGTQPNGQAQLRTSTDEDKLVNTGTNELKDDVLVQKSTDPNVWEITWLNVPVGDYKIYFQQQSGTGHTFLHDVTIKEIPANLVPKLTVKTTPSYCDAKAGTAMLQVKDGTAPYACTAVITRADGKTETLTKTITDNSWTIEGLAATEYVTFRVTDQGGQTVTAKSDVITNASVEVKTNNYIYVFQNGNGLCSFDYYVYVVIKTTNADAAKKQTEMLAQSMMLKKYDKYGEGDSYALEYDPNLDKNYTSSFYRYFKIPSSANLADKERFGLSYDKLCGGTVKANTYQYELRNLADMTNIYSSADGSLCDAESGTYKLNYNFIGENNYWSNTHYVFLDANKYGRILKESNGSYELVNDKVLMPTEKFPNWPFSNSIPLPGPGKYRFEYGSETDCPQTYFSKEFEVKLPSVSIKGADGGVSPSAVQCYTVYGNTAGIAFQIKNTGFPFTVEVSRPDNKSSFEVADFLTKNTYTKQIQFPVKVTYQKEQLIYVIGDLPAGEYVMKVKDACGQEAEQAFSIKDTDLQHYNPRNDEGYKNGVYVGIDCNGNNIVKMNYGSSCNNLGVAYSLNKNNKSWTTSGRAPYRDNYKEDNLIKKNAFSVSFHNMFPQMDGSRSSEFPYYSAIEKVDTVFNYGGQKAERAGNWATKAYKFNFENITGADATAFDVFGAMCKKDDPSSGMIAVGVKKGVNYTGTLSYELFTTADGTTPGTKVKENSDLVNNVWTNVQEGKYLVKITYGDGCETKKFVEVKAADIPLPGLETEIVDQYKFKDPIYVDITKNDKPLHLILPVSPSLVST